LLVVLFAMTINKSYFKRCVEYVKKKNGLKILITDEDGENTNVTSNVDYREVFRNVR